MLQFSCIRTATFVLEAKRCRLAVLGMAAKIVLKFAEMITQITVQKNGCFQRKVRK